MMANVNRNWASGLGADGNPVYAPANVIEVAGRKVYNPKDKHYAASGLYMRVLSNPAPSDAPSGQHYEFRAYEIADSAIRRVYVLVDDPPPPPRVFDPYKLMDELMKRNVWDAVKEWLQAAPEGWDRWSKAPDIDEGEPLFKSAVAAAKTAFGWSDADVEAILAASVKEGA